MGSAAASAAVRRALAPSREAADVSKRWNFSRATANREGAVRCARGGRAPQFQLRSSGEMAVGPISWTRVSDAPGPAQVRSALLRGPRIGATLASRQNKPAPASAALRRARSDAPHPAKNSRTWQKLPGYGTKGLGTPQKHAEMPHSVSEMPRRDAETANLEPILSHGVAEAVTFFAWCAASAPG